MPSHPQTTASRASLLILALLAVAGVAAGVAFFLRSSGEESIILSQGSTYTEAVVGTWQRVNPLFASGNGVDEDLVALVFSGLVHPASDGSVGPGLADLPEISKGGRTYTFHLREGLRWHDGEPITSADVAFTISAVQDPAFRGDTNLTAAWHDVVVEIPDTRTVVLLLPEASAPFLPRYGALPILPSHLLQGLSAEALRDAPFNSAPVGSGPYRVDLLTGSEARLTAYNDYHLGRPAISDIRLRFYTDYDAASRALANGGVDGLAFRSVPSAATLDELEAASVTVDTTARPAYLVLYLNNDAAIFQDERVRRAISIAVDREDLAALAYGGQGMPSSLPVSSQSWAYDASYDVDTVDLETARQLLDEAGWVSHPTTGIRTRLGTEFRITIRTDTDPGRVAVAGAIAAELEPLGIRATVASTSFAVLRRDFLQERRFEAALAVWDQGPDPDPYFAWHSSQTGTAGLNMANYGNAIADSLIEEGRRTGSNAVRVDMYTQFQEIWERTTPSVIIAYETFAYAHAPSVEPVLPALMSSASSRYVFIHEWHRS